MMAVGSDRTNEELVILIALECSGDIWLRNEYAGDSVGGPSTVPESTCPLPRTEWSRLGSLLTNEGGYQNKS